MTRIRQQALATSILILSGCSTLPDGAYPQSIEYEVRASYEFSSQPAGPIEVPASRQDLTVYELRTEPADLQESFSAGKRFLLVPPGCRELRLHCRYQVHGFDETSPDLPSPRRVFPGASKLSVL